MRLLKKKQPDQTPQRGRRAIEGLFRTLAEEVRDAGRIRSELIERVGE